MTTHHPSSTLQMLVIERCDPTRRAARYAVMGVDEALFGAVSLRQASRCIDHPPAAGRPDVETAPEALEIWLARKRRRGCSRSRDGVTRAAEADAGQGPSSS